MMKKVFALVLMMLMGTVPVLAYEEAGETPVPMAPLPVVKAEPVGFEKTAVLPQTAPLSAVARSGARAYVGREGAVAVLDMTATPAPTVVVTAAVRMDDEPLYVKDVMVHETAVYAYTDCYLFAFDRSNASSLDGVSSIELPCGEDNLADLSYMIIDGDHIYINHTTGFYVVDVTEPLNPAFVTDYDDAIWSDYSFDVEDGVAYLFGSLQLYIVDVSTPATPMLLHYHSGLPHVTAVDVVGDYAYTITSFSDFTIFDISDLSNPVVYKVYTYLNSSYGSLLVEGDYAYLLGDNGVTVIEMQGALSVTNIFQNLTVISDWVKEGEQLTLVGQGGLYNVATTNPEQLTLLTQWAQFSPSSLYFQDSVIEDGLLYVADEWQGLLIFDVTQPQAVTPVAVMGTRNRRHLAVSGDYVYVGGTSGISGMNVSNPYAPQWRIESFLGNAPVMGLAQQGTLLFVILDEFVRVYEIEADGWLTSLDLLPMGSPLVDITAVGNHVMVIDEAGFLTMIDVSVPTEMTVVGKTAVVGVPTSLVAADSKLYVATANSFNLFDVSDPTTPVLEMVYQENGVGDSPYIQALVWQDGLLYMDTLQEGTIVLDVHDPTAPYEVSRIGGYGGATAVDGGDLYVSGVWEAARGQLLPTIAGTVRDRSRHGVADVTVDVDETAVVSDESGQYRFGSNTFGTHLLAPLADGYTFWPPMQVVTTPLSYRGVDFVMVPEAQHVTASPTMSQTVGYEDVRGQQLAVTIPSGTVAMTTTVWLTPTLVQAPVGYSSSGHSFVLAADVISQPMTVTLHYDEADLRLLAEHASLGLYRWAGAAGWQTAVCGSGSSQHDSDTNVIEVPICQDGAYAFLGRSYTSFVPVMMANVDVSEPVAAGAIKLRVVHSGQCLTSAFWWTSIYQSSCKGSDAQKSWQQLPVGDGLFQLQLSGTKQCLTTSSATPATGTEVMLSSCQEDEVAQQWLMVTLGNYVWIMSEMHQQCLDILGGSFFQEQPAILWPCTGTQNQLWYVEAQ